MAASNLSTILLIEPFYGGSHKQLMDVLMADIPGCDLYSLPAKKWHWRARTSALHFALTIPKEHKYRTVFASSVLNLAELVALRPDLGKLHKVIYFHENQLVYPVRKHQERDFQYGYNQVLTSLVADVVLFNSKFNVESFLSGIPGFMKTMPDYRPRGLPDSIRPKCHVLYFPVKLPEVQHTESSKYSTYTQDPKEEKTLTNSCVCGSSSYVIKSRGSCTGEDRDYCRCGVHIKHHTVESKGIQYESLSEEPCKKQKYVPETKCETKMDVDTHVSSNAKGDALKETIIHQVHVQSKEMGSSFKDEESVLKSDSWENNTAIPVTHLPNFVQTSQVTEISVSKELDLQPQPSQKCLHIVWPHRWEHDKDPETFFETLMRLKEDGLDFRISVLGQSFSQVPDIFETAKEALKNSIAHWGHLVSKEAYYSVLSQADVVVSTAQHEFFGVAMVEATYSGCYPLCPNRLAYPEIFPDECLYNTPAQLYKKLKNFCKRPDLVKGKCPTIDLDRFTWRTLKPKYEGILQAEGKQGLS